MAESIWGINPDIVLRLLPCGRDVAAERVQRMERFHQLVAEEDGNRSVAYRRLAAEEEEDCVPETPPPASQEAEDIPMATQEEEMPNPPEQADGPFHTPEAPSRCHRSEPEQTPDTPAAPGTVHRADSPPSDESGDPTYDPANCTVESTVRSDSGEALSASTTPVDSEEENGPSDSYPVSHGFRHRYRSVPLTTRTDLPVQRRRRRSPSPALIHRATRSSRPLPLDHGIWVRQPPQHRPTLGYIREQEHRSRPAYDVLTRDPTLVASPSGEPTNTPLQSHVAPSPGWDAASTLEALRKHPGRVMDTAALQASSHTASPFDSGIRLSGGGLKQASVKEVCLMIFEPQLVQFFDIAHQAWQQDPSASKGRSNPFTDSGPAKKLLKEFQDDIKTGRMWGTGAGKEPAASARVPLLRHLQFITYAFHLVEAVSSSSKETATGLLPLLNNLRALRNQLMDAALRTVELEKSWQRSIEDLGQISSMLATAVLDSHKKSHEWRKLQASGDVSVKGLVSAITDSITKASAPSGDKPNGRRTRADLAAGTSTTSGVRAAASEYEPAGKQLRLRKTFEIHGLSDASIPKDAESRSTWFRTVPCRAHLDPDRGCFRGDAKCRFSHRWTVEALEKAGATQDELAAARRGG